MPEIKEPIKKVVAKFYGCDYKDNHYQNKHKIFFNNNYRNEEKVYFNNFENQEVFGDSFFRVFSEQSMLR
jgi:hypothetical protein